MCLLNPLTPVGKLLSTIVDKLILSSKHAFFSVHFPASSVAIYATMLAGLHPLFAAPRHVVSC